MNEQQILRKVEQAVDSNRMFRPGDRVLAGISGGPDSVALLHILLRLAPGRRLTLAAAHLDHALRGEEAERDADFAAGMCREAGVPFFTKKVDVESLRRRSRISVEMAGRRARYDFFREVAEAEGFDKIALGHHADDNAELVLMNILRGSGPLGTAGIPPIRGRSIVRPLIYLTRGEILYFLETNGLACLQDASNRDLRFLRNRIRHRLLPLIARDYNPKISEALNHLALIARAEEDWLDGRVHGAYSKMARQNGGRIEIAVRRLAGMPAALQRRILRKAIGQARDGLKRISYWHIEAVRRLTFGGNQEKRVMLPGGVSVRRDAAGLLIVGKRSPADPESGHGADCAGPYRYLIDGADSRPRTLLVAEAGLRLRWRKLTAAAFEGFGNADTQTAFFDMDRIGFPLTVRNFRSGDRFRPLGTGGSQKLKKFFIDRKVPRDVRRRVPLVLSDARILWVAGYRTAEDAKLTADSQNILKMELLLA